MEKQRYLFVFIINSSDSFNFSMNIFFHWFLDFSVAESGTVALKIALNLFEFLVG